MADYFESGFCVRTPSWHRKENLLTTAPANFTEARKAASIEWDVELVPHYRNVILTGGMQVTDEMVPVITSAAEVSFLHAATEVFTEGGVRRTVVRNGCTLPVMMPSEKSAGLVRNDTHAELGSVSPTYAPLYVEWMGEIAETLAGQGAEYETMISVNGGAQVAVLMKLDEPMRVAGDDTLTIPYFSILNDFTGGAAAKLVYTPVRVVCWNTYQMAAMMAEATGHQYVWRHTGDMRANVEQAKESLAGLRSSFAAWVELAEGLATQEVNEDEVKTFTSLFIPEPAGELLTDRQKANVAKQRGTFLKLYNESVTTDGHRGTALGLLDAAVEFADHIRGAATQDVLLTRTLVKPNVQKRGALALIHEVTGAKVPDSVKFN